MARLAISIVTETFAPDINGVATTWSYLIDGLVDNGHDVELVRPVPQLSTSPKTPVREIGVPGVPLPFYTHLRFGLPVRKLLLQHWRHHRPDVVHIVTEGPLGWTSMSAALALGLPVSTSFHTNFHRYSHYYGYGWLGKPLLGYLRHFHNKAALTLVPTKAVGKELASHGFQRLAVLGRGVDAGLFSPKKRDAALRQSWGILEDDLAIVYVGRLAVEKNIPLALKTFATIQKLLPRAKMIIVGDGPMRQTILHQYPGIVYCGPQHGEALARHYASCDLLLFPSLSETYGIVILEAMASGLAVVAFDQGAAKEHIVDRKNGFLVPLGNEGQFVETAMMAAYHRQEFKCIGQAAHESTLEHSWKHIVNQFEKRLFILSAIGANSHVTKPRYAHTAPLP
jgi:glycosyltransferase involved in cell wall biosynthesis